MNVTIRMETEYICSLTDILQDAFVSAEKQRKKALNDGNAAAAFLAMNRKVAARGALDQIHAKLNKISPRVQRRMKGEQA